MPLQAQTLVPRAAGAVARLMIDARLDRRTTIALALVAALALAAAAAASAVRRQPRREAQNPTSARLLARLLARASFCTRLVLTAACSPAHAGEVHLLLAPGKRREKRRKAAAPAARRAPAPLHAFPLARASTLPQLQ